jgi:hypothetical protein
MYIENHVKHIGYYHDINNNLIAEKTDNATLFFYFDTYNRLVETLV